MCLILFAFRAHPDYPLIVAANRDEFMDRPTEPAQFWKDHPDVLAGRDRVKGGTWMGITRSVIMRRFTSMKSAIPKPSWHTR